MNLKLVIISALFVLCFSCVSEYNVEVPNTPANTKVEVLKSVKSLRKAGFFENYIDLSDAQVYDTLYSLRKQFCAEVYDEPFDPGMNLSAIEVAQLDESKLLYMDLEADVMKGNEVYKEVIERFGVLSQGRFKPIDIKEVWKNETGPIEVSFLSNDSIIVFAPEYSDDWLDGSVFHICSKQLEKQNIRIMICHGEELYSFGQEIALMRLTEAEQKVLEEELNWEFTKE